MGNTFSSTNIHEDPDSKSDTSKVLAENDQAKMRTNNSLPIEKESSGGSDEDFLPSTDHEESTDLEPHQRVGVIAHASEPPNWDNLEENQFVCWSGQFGSFLEIIQFCLAHQIMHPHFTLIALKNTLTFQFSLVRHFPYDEEEEYVTISEVRFARFSGTDQHNFTTYDDSSLTYYPESNYLSGESLLTGRTSEGVYYFTFLLGQFFGIPPVFENNLKLIDLRLKEFYHLSRYSGMVPAKCCLWCGSHLETNFSPEPEPSYCQDCRACLVCSITSDLVEYPEGGIYCRGCIRNFYLADRLSGGRLRS